MGFDVAENTILLDFSQTRYAGVEVRIRPDAVSLRDYLEGWLKAATLEGEFRFLIEKGAIAEWNLERNGVAVPVRTEAIDDLPPGLAREIARAWMDAQVEVKAPLAPPSPAGGS